MGFILTLYNSVWCKATKRVRSERGFYIKHIDKVKMFGLSYLLASWCIGIKCHERDASIFRHSNDYFFNI